MSIVFVFAEIFDSFLSHPYTLSISNIPVSLISLSDIPYLINMPYSDKEKQLKAMQKINRKARERRDEQKKKEIAAETKFQQKYHALRVINLGVPPNTLKQTMCKNAEETSISFENLMNTVTNNKVVISTIDFIFESHAKMMDLVGSFTPEQKQFWIDSAKNVKEMIWTDLITAFQEGEKLGIQLPTWANKQLINKLEDKKTNE